MTKLGRLERVDLRDVWRHEERDFSTWLAQEENISLLADELGIEIGDLQREARVGRFELDILAEEAGTGRKVIIENQLEHTNHDHLGKIITYAAGYDAEIIVWIVREARDEHRRAIEWLNEHTDENVGFFLVRMEVWKIGDSPPAPRFHLVSQPNDWAKVVKTTARSGSLSDTKLLQLEFWTDLKELAENESAALNFRQPRPRHWYDVSIGSSRAHISLTINKSRKEINVSIYIPDDKQLFQCLFGQKDTIEQELGMKLKWEPLPKNKASYIRVSLRGDYTDKERWPELHRWVLETVKAFDRVFGPRIQDCMEEPTSDA